MRALLLALLLLVASPAFALDPSDQLTDPALEARAVTISSELRCLVCQNQSIEESDADLAKELRILVRERITAGDSDDAVRSYIVARYGEFVLLKPVFALHTLLLWIAAPMLLLVGVVILVLRGRRLPAIETPLSAEEKRALDELSS